MWQCLKISFVHGLPFTTSIQDILYILNSSLMVPENSKVNASKFLENTEELFSQYHICDDILNGWQSSNTNDNSCICFVCLLGYQHIRMYDLLSANSNHVISYDNISKNVVAVGFQEDGNWMFTGGEDHSARIWDLRYNKWSILVPTNFSEQIKNIFIE